MTNDEASKHTHWLEIYMDDGTSICRIADFDTAIKASIRLLKREHLVKELIDACKHTKREPAGRVMRAVKALEEFES